MIRTYQNHFQGGQVHATTNIFQGFKQQPAIPFWITSHTIHGTGIFPYIYHKNQPNVAKYASPMDGMGFRKKNRSDPFVFERGNRREFPFFETKIPKKNNQNLPFSRCSTGGASGGQTGHGGRRAKQDLSGPFKGARVEGSGNLRCCHLTFSEHPMFLRKLN